MRSSHAAGAVSASFDEANLVSCAGLVPLMRLAERCGLYDLARQSLAVPGSAGANAGLKVGCLVAGMATGADSIDDMDVLRHGAMGRLFGGVRAPSTLGAFLRAHTWGHAQQTEKITRMMLARLAAHTPLLPGVDQLAFLDVDSSVSQVYGHAKQGAGFGYTKVRGLHPLVATVSTPQAAPVVTATRLRRGAAGSARAADSFITEAIASARQAGAIARLVLRADSAFYSAAVVTACQQAGVYFSITVRQDPAVRRAIAAIDEQAWKAIRYPRAVWDDEARTWISDAQIAETTYTAFTSTGTPVTARLIVRRVRDLNTTVADGQGELFPAWRYHAVFTNSPFVLEQAEAHHRAHAIVEQVIADLKSSALAHFPSASFAANAAWLSLAALAHNLTRAAGALASTFHARATTATIRRQLIDIPARLARSARRLTLHLPENWRTAWAWQTLFDATHPAPT